MFGRTVNKSGQLAEIETENKISLNKTQQRPFAFGAWYVSSELPAPGVKHLGQVNNNFIRILTLCCYHEPGWHWMSEV